MADGGSEGHGKRGQGSLMGFVFLWDSGRAVSLLAMVSWWGRLGGSFVLAGGLNVFVATVHPPGESSGSRASLVCIEVGGEGSVCPSFQKGFWGEAGMGGRPATVALPPVTVPVFFTLGRGVP